MLVFKYTVKWRARGWFFRRLHGVKTVLAGDGQFRLVKFNGTAAYFPIAGTEVVIGRGVEVKLG